MWQFLGFGAFLARPGVLLIILGIAALTRKRTCIVPWLKRFFRLLLVLGALLAALAGVNIGSRWHTSTPLILEVDGRPLPGSIATMERVTLNGRQQWITVRSKNLHKPVPLFLVGSPVEVASPDAHIL